MRRAREIIRLKSSCVSAHEIARLLGMARSTAGDLETGERREAVLASSGRHDRRRAGNGALRQPAQQKRPPAHRGAGLGLSPSRTEAQARHPC